MTFVQLQDRALKALNFSTATTSDARTRVKEAINDWHRRLLTKPGFSRLLRDRQMTLTSVASTHTYSFGASVQRINGLTDTTNDEPLLRRDLGWLRRVDPGLDQTGIPTAYVFLGKNTSGNLQVQLWPTPQSAASYIVDYTAQLQELSADADEPLLPEDFHHMLAIGAQHDEWRRQDDDRWQVVRADLAQLENALHRWVWDLADSTDERRDYARPASRLGAWFPEGS